MKDNNQSKAIKTKGASVAPEKSKQYIELEKKFLEQVNKDKVNLKYQLKESHYIPNPYLTDSPKFVLVALEPNLGALKFKKQVEFLSSFRNFLLHYCAYKHLCGGNFDYHFTDISKSAMESKEANVKGIRKEIYQNWLPLLKEELQVLSDSEQPKVISIGNAAKGYLENGKEPIEVYINVLHYGNNNDGRFKKYFEEHLTNKAQDFEQLFDEVKNFAVQLMTYLKFTEEEIQDRFSADFGMFDVAKLTVRQKQQLIYRYLYYKSEFENITK